MIEAENQIHESEANFSALRRRSPRPRMTIADVAKHVEDVVRIPPVTGITADAAGHLYQSAMTEDGVLKLTPNGKLETLIPDDRIAGPNEGSIGPDGYYDVPNSRAPLVNRPYEMFKIPLA